MHNGQTFPYRPDTIITDGATEEGSRAGFWTSP
jgi:hypothetical protein